MDLGLPPQEKMGCNFCYRWQGLRSELLEAAHPIRPGVKVFGCPKCLHEEGLKSLCCIKGCTEFYFASVNNKRYCRDHYQELPYD